MLLKLVHEFENRPDFGNKYNNDPDGAAQSWLARVGALMSRVSIERDIGFRSNIQTSVTYWAPAMKNAQIEVRKAIEDLRLELELYPEDDIGHVYAPGEHFRFFKDVAAIISESTRSVFLVDPYLDAPHYSAFFSRVRTH
jgi:hypothetical protein